MTSIFDAHGFVIWAHAGQLDKRGQPYVRHLERVANATVARVGHAITVDQIDLDQIEIVQAALLHDVLAATSTTSIDLRAAGFSLNIVETVMILTKPRTPISYALRIRQIIESDNLSEILIKMSDNEDNLRPERTLQAGEMQSARYRSSFERLKEAAAKLGYSGS